VKRPDPNYDKGPQGKAVKEAVFSVLKIVDTYANAAEGDHNEAMWRGLTRVSATLLAISGVASSKAEAPVGAQMLLFGEILDRESFEPGGAVDCLTRTEESP